MTGPTDPETAPVPPAGGPKTGFGAPQGPPGPARPATERGLFIVIEGGDGAGKSTQTDLLADWLNERGLTVRRTFEPGATRLGQQIRQLVLDPATADLAPRAEALLYAADKAQHLHEVIEPALRRGEIVVSDRYVESMLAYQGAGRVLDPAEVAAIAWWSVESLRPDLTVLLDISVGLGLAEKAQPDRLEQAGRPFHERVRGFFLQLAEADPTGHLVIDARSSRDEVARAIRRRVGLLLG